MLAWTVTLSDTARIGHLGGGAVQHFNLKNRARQAAAAGAIGMILTLGGAGVAGAQDEHSGGTSPNSESVDPGTQVKGNVVTRRFGRPARHRV